MYCKLKIWAEKNLQEKHAWSRLLLEQRLLLESLLRIPFLRGCQALRNTPTVVCAGCLLPSQISCAQVLHREHSSLFRKTMQCWVPCAQTFKELVEVCRSFFSPLDYELSWGLFFFFFLSFLFSSASSATHFFCPNSNDSVNSAGPTSRSSSLASSSGGSCPPSPSQPCWLLPPPHPRPSHGLRYQATEIFQLRYNPMDHTCGPALTEAPLCGSWLCFKITIQKSSE